MADPVGLALDPAGLVAPAADSCPAAAAVAVVVLLHHRRNLLHNYCLLDWDNYLADWVGWVRDPDSRRDQAGCRRWHWVAGHRESPAGRPAGSLGPGSWRAAAVVAGAAAVAVGAVVAVVVGAVAVVEDVVVVVDAGAVVAVVAEVVVVGVEGVVAMEAVAAAAVEADLGAASAEAVGLEAAAGAAAVIEGAAVVEPHWEAVVPLLPLAHTVLPAPLAAPHMDLPAGEAVAAGLDSADLRSRLVGYSEVDILLVRMPVMDMSVKTLVFVLDTGHRHRAAGSLEVHGTDQAHHPIEAVAGPCSAAQEASAGRDNQSAERSC